MSSKYLSKRAIGLHFALLLWVTLCVLAAIWQVGRAAQGNSLSFLYSIEWPIFGVLGVLGWYALLNIEQVSDHQRRAREEYEAMMRAAAQREASSSSDESSAGTQPPTA